MGGRISPAPIGVAGEVAPDFLARPPRLVNIRKPFREAHTLLAHERGYAQDPAAVGSIILRPKAPPGDGRRGPHALCSLFWQPPRAEISPFRGKAMATSEITRSNFQHVSCSG